MDEGLVEINRKLDAIMEHIGCKSMATQEYLNLPDDKKDEIDEANMKDNK